MSKEKRLRKINEQHRIGPRGDKFKFKRCSKNKNGVICTFTNTQKTSGGAVTIKWTLQIHYDRSGNRVPQRDREIGKIGRTKVTFNDGITGVKTGEAYAKPENQQAVRKYIESQVPKISSKTRSKPIKSTKTKKEKTEKSEKEKTEKSEKEKKKKSKKVKKSKPVEISEADAFKALGSKLWTTPPGNEFDLVKCAAKQGEGINCEFLFKQANPKGDIKFTLYIAFDDSGNRAASDDKMVGEFGGHVKTFESGDTPAARDRCAQAYSGSQKLIDAWVLVCVSKKTRCDGSEVVWEGATTGKKQKAYMEYDNQYYDAYEGYNGYIDGYGQLDGYHPNSGASIFNNESDEMFGGLMMVHVLLIGLLIMGVAVCLGCIIGWVVGKKTKANAEYVNLDRSVVNSQ